MFFFSQENLQNRFIETRSDLGIDDFEKNNGIENCIANSISPTDLNISCRLRKKFFFSLDYLSKKDEKVLPNSSYPRKGFPISFMLTNKRRLLGCQIEKFLSSSWIQDSYHGNNTYFISTSDMFRPSLKMPIKNGFKLGPPNEGCLTKTINPEKLFEYKGWSCEEIRLKEDLKGKDAFFCYKEKSSFQIYFNPENSYEMKNEFDFRKLIDKIVDRVY